MINPFQEFQNLSLYQLPMYRQIFTPANLCLNLYKNLIFKMIIYNKGMKPRHFFMLGNAIMIGFFEEIIPLQYFCINSIEFTACILGPWIHFWDIHTEINLKGIFYRSRFFVCLKTFPISLESNVLSIQGLSPHNAISESTIFK